MNLALLVDVMSVIEYKMIYAVVIRQIATFVI